MHVKILLMCIFAHALASAFDEPISLAIYNLIKQAELSDSGLSDGNGFHLVQRTPWNVEYLDDENAGSDLTKMESLGNPEVDVKNGIVIGTTLPESHAFFSVPFGKPPVDDKRFMAPEPAENFSGPFNATTPDGKMCYQVRNYTEYGAMMSEDCLVLNVYVPTAVDLSNSTTPPSDRLPVLVWLYGGFFFTGRATSSKTDGRWLSQASNAIVVNINYRVGPLGFLIFEENGSLIEGNQGLKDQQLGMQWVQDNIHKFGGDPDRVTLFGESAGGQSILFHLVSENSKDLFNRAIMESNPAVFPYQNATEALTITSRVVKAIGFTCRNKDDATCLREATAFDITDTRNTVMVGSLFNGDFYSGIEPFRPYIDGVEYTDQPLNLVQMGHWHTDKEVIIGTNNEEMSYVTEVVSLFPNFDETDFDAVNKLILGEEDGATISKLYSDAYNQSLNYSAILGQEVTDMFFVCPSRALARFASRTSTNTNQAQVPVYLYNYAYALNEESCNEIQDFTPVCGTAFHSSEIIFVFKSDTGHGTNFTETDKVVSDMFTTYWGGFANTGVPSSGLTTSLGEFSGWPAYTESSEANQMWTNIRIQEGQSITEASYREHFCDTWDSIDYYVTRSPSVEPSTAPDSNTTSMPTESPNLSESTGPGTSQDATTVDLAIVSTVGAVDPETTSGGVVYSISYGLALTVAFAWGAMIKH